MALLATVHLAKIETGKRGCSLDILIDFAAFFNASLDYLVLGKVSDSEVTPRNHGNHQARQLAKLLS